MSKKRIMVIDDEPDMVELIQGRLEIAGYEVFSANDGVEGLEKAKKERPDLIILDLMLPKMDGFHVSRMLKYDEDYRNIPIIMLTARASISDKTKSSEVGADAYITKPFEPEQLLGKVSELLNRS